MVGSRDPFNSLKRRLRHFLVGGYACLLALPATAENQYLPDRDWSRLSIPGFDLIYPSGQRATADRVAERLTTYWPALQADLPMQRPPRRIPILLSTPTAISNGLVRFDPFQSVFYNRPSPLGGLPWLDLLSVHEGRHLVQMRQPLDTWTGRLARTLAGEWGLAGQVALFYPRWLLEGDAVHAETRLSTRGRGRMASFDLWLRGHALNRPRYSYDRAILGTGHESYPQVSPYDLGFLLTDHLRRQHGDDLIDRALARTAVPGRSLSFDGAVRQLSGTDLAGHYHQAWDTLERYWRERLAALTPTPVTRLWQPDGDHWHSLYPLASEAGSVLAVEVDLGDGAFLSRLADGRVERLAALPARVAAAYTGTAKQRGVSYADGRFCWVDRRTHPRFALEVRTGIDCLDVRSGERRPFPGPDDATSVALDAAGEYLAVHRSGPGGDSRLALYDRRGHRVAEQPLPPFSLAYDLAPDEGAWVFVLLDEGGSRLMRWRPDGSGLTELAVARDETLRAPLAVGDWLLYTSDRSGIDSLWALDSRSGERFQISQRPLGNYYPVADASANRLVVTDYGPDGHALVALDWHDPDRAEPDWLAAEPPRSPAPPAPASRRPPPRQATPYSPLSDAWRPTAWLVTADQHQASGLLHANNLLNTLGWNLSAGYHWGGDRAIGAAEVHWRRHWPVLSLGASRRVNAEDERLDSQASVTLTLPLSITRGLWSQSFQAGLTASHSHREALYGDATAGSTLAGVDLTLEASREGAPRDLQSPWAARLALAVDGEARTDAAQGHLRTRLQLPGALDNHHLTLTGQAQYRQQGFNGPGRYQRPAAFDDLAVGDRVVDSALDYRFSLGPLATAIGRLAFLRRLEAGFEARHYDSGAASASAWGARLAIPSNLLRNSRLRVDPAATVYYRPDEPGWRYSLSIRLGS